MSLWVYLFGVVIFASLFYFPLVVFVPISRVRMILSLSKWLIMFEFNEWLFTGHLSDHSECCCCQAVAYFRSILSLEPRFLATYTIKSTSNIKIKVQLCKSRLLKRILLVETLYWNILCTNYHKRYASFLMNTKQIVKWNKKYQWYNNEPNSF